jgi:threonine/homoserine/homoserine lactone efflux protein
VIEKLAELGGGLLGHPGIHREAGALRGTFGIVAMAGRAVGAKQLERRRLFPRRLLRQTREREKERNQSLSAHEPASERIPRSGPLETLNRLRVPGDDEKAMLMEFSLPLRGIAAGLMIAAPVGPVNVLCIQRSLQKGWKSGLVSGFGAALVDTLYGGIAGFSISLVIEFLIREQNWIRLIGGFLLIAIGVAYYFRKPLSLEAESRGAEQSDFVSAFLLTATNPTTVLSFIAILAMLGQRQQQEPVWQTSLLVGGIFMGSMSWWIVLTGGASLLRDKVGAQSMRWLNRIGGLAIAAFGLVNILLSHPHKG